VTFTAGLHVGALVKFTTAQTLSTGVTDASLVTYDPPFTGGVITTVEDKLAQTVSVMDFGADPTGATSSDAAFAAATLVALGKCLHIPAGTYKLVTAGGWVCPGFTQILGDGSGSTRIQFEPTTNGACLSLVNGAAQTVLAQVSGLQFYSPDTTYQKTAILIVDSSSVTIDDIYIHGAGTGTPSAPYWSDSANSSIGISTRGREATSISNIRCFANYPIYIGANPNASSQTLEDIDHWHFYNMYLIGKGNYCITVQAGVGMSHAVFDGYQAWVGGTGGISMDDTRVAGGGFLPSRNIAFKNVRTEQITVSTNYAFNLGCTSAFQQISFENILIGSGSYGINVNKFDRMTMSNVTTAVTGVALALVPQGAGSVAEMEGVLIDPAGTIALTNLVPSRISAYYPSSYAFPTSATYVFTSTAPYSQWMALGKSVDVTAPADTNENILATINIPANVMGPYGALKIRAQWYTTNNANVKTARVRLGGIGGTDYYGANLAGNLSIVSELVIQNRNDVASQYGPPLGLVAGLGVSALGPTTSTVNTAAATTLVITAQKATAGDTMILISWIVECCAG
jgi:hypothetical protein